MSEKMQSKNNTIKEDRREELRELNSFRSFLTHIYTYGFYSQAEMSKIVSKKQYEVHLSRLKELYHFNETAESGSQSVLSVRKTWKVRRFCIQRDHFNGQTELLSAVYGLHSISEREAWLAVILLSLYCSDHDCPPPDLFTSVVVRVFKKTSKAYKELASSDDMGELAVARCRQDLADAGYLVKGSPQKKSNFFKNLSNEDLLELYQLASFFAGSGYPRIPAVFLKKALIRVLRFRGMEQLPEIFLFRDCPSVNVLDEDLVFQLLKCCRDTAVIRLNPQKKKKASRSSKLMGRMVCPIALMPDTKLGRWYLQGVMDGKACNIRLTNIQTIERMEEKRLNDTKKKHLTNPEYQQFDRANMAAQIDYRTQNSYLCLSDGEQPICVEAYLHFEDAFIRQQFEREILLGEITERDGKEIYSVMVNHLSEIRPLIRSYFRYLELPPDSALRQELTEEYGRMMKNYGAVSQIL